MFGTSLLLPSSGERGLDGKLLVIFLVGIPEYLVPLANSRMAPDGILFHQLVLEFLWGWSRKSLITWLLAEMSGHPAVTGVVPADEGVKLDFYPSPQDTHTHLPRTQSARCPASHSLASLASCLSGEMMMATPFFCHLLCNTGLVVLLAYPETPLPSIYFARVGFLSLDSLMSYPPCPLPPKLWFPVVTFLILFPLSHEEHLRAPHRSPPAQTWHVLVTAGILLTI